ncbi:unnamed protein product, partial [Amoebophrya sp. A120]
TTEPPVPAINDNSPDEQGAGAWRTWAVAVNLLPASYDLAHPPQDVDEGSSDLDDMTPMTSRQMSSQSRRMAKQISNRSARLNSQQTSTGGGGASVAGSCSTAKAPARANACPPAPTGRSFLLSAGAAPQGDQDFGGVARRGAGGLL